MMRVSRNPCLVQSSNILAGLALAALFAFPATAQEAADDIAARFASDGKADTSAARTGAGGGGDEAERQRSLIEQAREAVARAIAKETHPDEDAAEVADAAVDRPVGDETAGREALSPPDETPLDAAPSTTDAKPDPSGAPAADDSLTERLRRIRREHAASEASVPPARGEDDGSDRAAPTGDAAPSEKSLVDEVMSRLATKAAGYISPLVEKHVTVLLIMDVGDKGVRRWSKTADPMICIHESCFISRGADQSAEKLTREAAFGPTVALTKRGGACRSKPACIFRDVDLETVEAKLQAVDLRFLRHDRRGSAAVRADSTCAMVAGQLSCRSPVEGASWRAWVVPESVAREAGALGLQAALEAGLK